MSLPAILPRSRVGVVYAVGSRSVTLVVVTWSMSAVISEPRVIGFAAKTVGSSVATEGPDPRFPWTMKTIPMNATMAKKTPMSRTNRFERFKVVSPEPCDRWHQRSYRPPAAHLYKWARTSGKIRQEITHDARWFAR